MLRHHRAQAMPRCYDRTWSIGHAIPCHCAPCAKCTQQCVKLLCSIFRIFWFAWARAKWIRRRTRQTIDQCGWFTLWLRPVPTRQNGRMQGSFDPRHERCVGSMRSRHAIHDRAYHVPRIFRQLLLMRACFGILCVGRLLVDSDESASLGACRCCASCAHMCRATTLGCARHGSSVSRHESALTT